MGFLFCPHASHLRNNPVFIQFTILDVIHPVSISSSTIDPYSPFVLKSFDGKIGSHGSFTVCSEILWLKQDNAGNQTQKPRVEYAQWGLEFVVSALEMAGATAHTRANFSAFTHEESDRFQHNHYRHFIVLWVKFCINLSI